VCRGRVPVVSVNWLRYVQRLIVRRVVWIVVGLVVYAAFNLSHATWAFPSECSGLPPAGLAQQNVNTIAEGEALALSMNLANGQNVGPGQASVYSHTAGDYIYWTIYLEYIPNGNQLNCGIVWNVTNDPICPTGYSEGTGSQSEPECQEDQADCPFVAGEQFIKFGTGTPPATRCDNGCGMDVQASVIFPDGYVAGYAITGNCSPDTGDGAQEGLNCISSTSGTTYCVDPGDLNCGTVNGEYVCLDSVPPGNCILTPDGQAICEGGSQTDPADSTFEDGNGNSFDVYTDGDTGQTTGGSDDTGGSVGAAGGPEGESLTPGSLPADNEAVDGFGDATLGFWARIEAAPIIAAITAIPLSLPAGSCTAVDSDPVSFFDGQVLIINAHCELWDFVSLVLFVIMLGAWALLGALIILRA